MCFEGFWSSWGEDGNRSRAAARDGADDLDTQQSGAHPEGGGVRIVEGSEREGVALLSEQHQPGTAGDRLAAVLQVITHEHHASPVAPLLHRGSTWPERASRCRHSSVTCFWRALALRSFGTTWLLTSCKLQPARSFRGQQPDLEGRRPPAGQHHVGWAVGAALTTARTLDS